MTTPLTMPRQRTLTVKPAANDFITEISALEQRVAKSASRLDYAAKLHHRDLTRLAVLRARIGLDTPLVPEVGDLATAGVPEGWFVGRVFQRDRLTSSSKTSGSIGLSAGLAIQWSASAFYVDTLEPLFNGVPIMVQGPFKDRVLCISAAKPAPLTYWNDDEISQYDTVTRHDATYLQRVTNARKTLMGQHKSTCQNCGGHIGKPSRASLIKHASGYRLVCRPCKQAWVDAGRPAEAVTQ